MNALLSRLGIVGELFQFFWHRKLWWLMPMLFMLFLFGIVIVLGNTSGVGPFIYTLF